MGDDCFFATRCTIRVIVGICIVVALAVGVGFICTWHFRYEGYIAGNCTILDQEMVSSDGDDPSYCVSLEIKFDSHYANNNIWINWDLKNAYNDNCWVHFANYAAMLAYHKKLVAKFPTNSFQKCYLYSTNPSCTDCMFDYYIDDTGFMAYKQTCWQAAMISFGIGGGLLMLWFIVEVIGCIYICCKKPKYTLLEKVVF